MRAIRIDATHRTVEDIDLQTGQLPEIYAAVGCRYIEAVYPPILTGRDALLVDEEGKLHDPKVCFRIRLWHESIAGNGLIVGVDREGETADCKTPLALARQAVQFGIYK